MKSIKVIKGFFATAMAVVLLSATSAAPLLTKENAYDPSGSWTYEVSMPEGTLTGDMEIKKVEDEYEVSIETDQFGTLELEDVTLEENIMEGNVEIDGAIIDFEFEFDGDSMEGTVSAGQFGTFDLEGERISNPDK